jgi:hypothetical protein
MLIDHWSFVRWFDPRAYHYGVLQVAAANHQHGCVRNCTRLKPHCVSIDHLVWIPSDPFQKHVFLAIEVWTKPSLEFLLYHVEVNLIE